MNPNAERRISNPSPYQLPQFVTEDRRRARQLTITLNRENYPIVHDDGLPDQPEANLPSWTGPWPKASKLRKIMTKVIGTLPPKELFLSELPPEARFTSSKFFRHATHAVSMKMRQAWSTATNLDFQPQSANAYSRLMGTIPPPRIKDTWLEDLAFARQRLAGVNPMAIKRCANPLNDAMMKGADDYLKERHNTSINKALESGRIYMTEYPLLSEKAVQDEVRKNATLSAPTCLFHVDAEDNLMPLAIQLRPTDTKQANPVFTPGSEYWDWRLARAHVHASDSHYHEAVSHLLETHLVSEVFAMATLRHLHPDHPLSQLLTPHFEHTLAINEQARKNLLAKHGEIAKCMAAKHTGSINLCRLVWSDWKYNEHGLHSDLTSRDVYDIPGYLYRDDSVQVYKAIDDYVRGILSIWYLNDEDVRNDTELRGWSH